MNNMHETKNRIAALAALLDGMNWQTLEQHSPDDLEADAVDALEIQELARQIANDFMFVVTHPSFKNGAVN